MGADGERGGHGLGSAASRLFGYKGSRDLERLPKAFTTLFTARWFGCIDADH
jgi:hypothetical protein